jgi:hypothetical protein
MAMGQPAEGGAIRKHIPTRDLQQQALTVILNSRMRRATSRQVCRAEAPATMKRVSDTFAQLIQSVWCAIVMTTRKPHEGILMKGFTDRTAVANTLVPFNGQRLLHYGAADRVIGLATWRN